jgi:hypothetical protein
MIHGHYREEGIKNMLKLKKYKKKIFGNNGPQRKDKALKASRSHLEDLYWSCLRSITPITEPLALISQIQRSGGSLLSQLFDGHPEIYAHPDELKIGYPKKYIWPKIDLSGSPEQWFSILFEEGVINHFKEGYKKGHKSERTYSFIFLASLQKRIFFRYLDSLESVTLREIFNAYMSSYFGSWLNYHNIYGDKKFITGFTPRLSMSKENMGFFFKVYPDGRLISIIRDPRNWFPSAAKHGSKKYIDLRKAINQWNENALSMLRNKDRYKHRVIIISFEDLIKNTEPVMRSLADFLKMEFDDILLVPTFNKFPMVANTSFQAEKAGIADSTLFRYKTLTHEELDIIDEMTRGNYKKVLNKADRAG